MLPTIAIPRTDLKLSAICLGNTLFNPNIPPDRSDALYTLYRKAGGNSLDTGHCYCFWLPNGNATNERNLGRAVRQHGENPISRGRLNRAAELAGKLGVRANQVALAYVMNQRFPVIALLGTSNPEHLAEGLSAATIRLSPEQVRWLADGSAPQ